MISVYKISAITNSFYLKISSPFLSPLSTLWRGVRGRGLRVIIKKNKK
jgi:hypothetical protein